MNKKMMFLVVLLTGLFLYPLTGYSQEAGKFGLGVRGGWYESNDAEEGKLYGGIQSRWKLLPALAIEGAVDYRSEESYPNNRKVTSYPVLVSALFYPIPDAKISPYLLGGVGWYFLEVKDNQGSNTTKDFGAHVGFGLDIPLNPNVVFNTDLRYYSLDIKDQRIRDLDANGYIVSAGLTFYLW